MQPRLVIAGTGSGVGKTTFSIGLMGALKQRGYNVQGFKCGPDYIDPSYHTAITGRNSRNLDSWMLDKEKMLDVFVKGSQGADISIIEGVMGLYDGKRPDENTGSTAEISMLLKAPVILMVNISSMARSAAAIVKGFQNLEPQVYIAGVVVNQAGSEGHYKLCKTAIEKECGIPVLGYLKKGDVPSIPERHLGLVPAIERGELDGFFEELSQVISAQVDIERLMELARKCENVHPSNLLFSSKGKSKNTRIAVAVDAAFNFYYPENIELLEEEGAEIVPFSPLQGESIPEKIDGLYIGGGFPEEFAAELAEQKKTKEQIKELGEKGLPIFAECGGYMYLADTITTTDGKVHSMVGLIPADVEMQEKRAALGYRDITAAKDTMILKAGETARGHEFHYSTLNPKGDYPHAYRAVAFRKEQNEGYHRSNITAGYTHIHFGSNPAIASRFVSVCQAWKSTLNSL
ncbi:cobyrinate a,c-diamide synthase [Thalassobacillus sp. C254]|uniref:cobyrinate a,c-diamide synthase n=1 Tax=Thalassobacillus sp. C254 TaxID=1225341 RepID=UPI0006D23727|nr:cobyrinate a,c-diamide synthase [Thalassobacillus sp. C254]